MSGAWSWLVTAGKAVTQVFKTIVVWAWEHPVAASLTAFSWELIRRTYAKRKARGETTIFGDFLADLFGGAGDYVQVVLAVVSVGRGVYDLFSPLGGVPQTGVGPGVGAHWLQRSTVGQYVFGVVQ